MADIKFACPTCGQHITCDELWGGHQIQCPGCQGAVTVPPRVSSAPAAAHAPVARPSGPPPPPPPSLVPRVPEKTKLSLGAAEGAHPAAGGQGGAQRTIPIRNLAPPPPKKKSPVKTILTVVGVVALLAVAGYVGWPYVAPMLKKNTGAESAKKTEPAPAATPTPGTEVPGMPDPGAAPSAAAPADAAAASKLPVIEPKYTLDVARAKIPEGRVNGIVSSNAFVAETIRIDQVGTAQALRFLEGQIASPDREVLVYLHIKPTDKVSGQKLNISSDMRGSSVPQVMKRWKTNPRYAPQSKTFSSGYAMKLDLGTLTNGILTGKIYLAFPDKEESVIAGVFQATSTLREGAADGSIAAPAATPGAIPSAEGMSPAERANFQRRYGIAPK